MKALYAGSFDPVTLGHLDIINRARRMVDTLVVGIGVNPAKKPWFCMEIREEFLSAEVKNFAWPNVEIRCFTGLTVDYAKKIGASILVRGIRGSADLEYEMYVARLNKKLSGIETIFLAPSDEFLVLSSTYVKQIWEYGKDPNLLRNLVPERIVKYLELHGGPS